MSTEELLLLLVEEANEHYGVDVGSLEDFKLEDQSNGGTHPQETHHVQDRRKFNVRL